jgi:tRNA/rRNA methyltransferase
MNPDHIAIVLHRPQIPENIGAAARAMNNMGLKRLILSAPENCELSRVVKMATGTSIDIIEQMEVYDTLEQALGPFNFVAGTTARIGSHRPPMTSPRALAVELSAISDRNHAALLFGPEDRGLANADLRVCHTIVRIPTSGFSSLNLAQAVMILCYEILMVSGEPAQKSIPRLADGFELEGMYSHLKEVLLKIGFIDRQNPEHWMLNLRRFFSRIQLRAREVRVIRGICRQMDWYTEQIKKSERTTYEPNRSDCRIDDK